MNFSGTNLNTLKNRCEKFLSCWLDSSHRLFSSLIIKLTKTRKSRQLIDSPKKIPVKHKQLAFGFILSCALAPGHTFGVGEFEDVIIVDIKIPFPPNAEISKSGLAISISDVDQDSLDSDNDGLTDSVEEAVGTNPYRVDSDCDGWLDPDEVMGSDGQPTIRDQDGDGIVDGMENRYFDSDQDGISDPEDADTLYQFVCGQFSPFAITDTESVVFSVTAVSSNISRLILNPGQGDFELFDDGTHGDVCANDGVFTSANLTWDAFLQVGYSSSYQANRLGIHPNSGEYVELSTFWLLNGNPGVERVSANELAPYMRHGPNFWLSDHVAAIVNPGLAARVVGGEARAAVIQFLAEFGDNYDFVQVYPQTRGAPRYAAYHASVVNEVQGIGISLYNNRETLGVASDGRILGYHWQNNSPGPGATTHEIMHQWQAFAASELGFGQCVGGHWGILGHGRGVMGGFDPDSLSEVSPGIFEVDPFSTCCGVGQIYTPLELYFAGFLAAEEVPPVTVPVNADCGSLSCSAGKCTFAADGLEMVTINDVIALEGPRSPGVGEAQTHFTVAHILVTEHPPTQSELTAIAKKALVFEDVNGDFSFAKTSGGRASADTIIDDGSEIPIFQNGFEVLHRPTPHACPVQSY